MIMMLQPICWTTIDPQVPHVEDDNQGKADHRNDNRLQPKGFQRGQTIRSHCDGLVTSSQEEAPLAVSKAVVDPP